MDESDPPRRLLMNAPNETQERPVLATTQARQGVTGQNVRYVLGASIAAVVVAFAAIWIYYFA
jgi:hypothetical protein